MLRAWCLVLALAGCGVRTPAAIDVDALVRARGQIEARRDLVIRVTSEPRDVAARLALAALDERDRPGDAIEQLEAVVKLGGPIGVRWHDGDRARLGRLIAARGRARLARGAASALGDLDRARSLGAAVPDAELRAARAARAIVELRHSDRETRERGRRTLAELADADHWKGAATGATLDDRGRFGAWLWTIGARRGAWDELSAWHDVAHAPRDPALQQAYLVALRWWTPLDRPCADPSELDRGACPITEAASADAPAPELAEPLREIVATYHRDPAVADRLARDAVAAAPDAAAMHAATGALFDTLGDPSRARRAWQAAVDASPEPAFLRGLAEAQARQGDADAALITATAAAAASGDPAVVWTAVARALVGVGKYVHALDAARSAIDLADGDTLGGALDAAIAASRALGRTEQADRLLAQRAQLLGPEAR